MIEINPNLKFIIEGCIESFDTIRVYLPADEYLPERDRQAVIFVENARNFLKGMYND